MSSTLPARDHAPTAAWLLDRTEALCRADTTTGREDHGLPALRTLLREVGATIDLQEVAPGRHNVLATWGTPRLLFSTHLDTVPPFLPPKLEGDRLVGRGVIDAKGIAAAMIAAWERLLARGETRVGLMFVVGEETNSDGAKAAAEGGFAPHVKHFINGEPTDGVLVRAMKGVLAFELDVEGKAAHSA